MAGRIPREFIDELLQRIDIVEVVGNYVPLKKAGRDLSACCPFHDEKTPSFTVSPEKQFYHCFGCGAHGTAIGFLMEHRGMSFPEAVEELAHKAGMEVPKSSAPQIDERSAALYQILARADRYYRKMLREHDAAGQAIEYLKGRGLSGTVAARFGLGFAPPGWGSLLRALGEDDESRQALLDAGLVIQGERGPYDRFRERIMFPIRDPRGRTIAFGGRALGTGEPKYLNSPEHPLFHKRQALYGLYESRRAMPHPQQLLVVEGYMDVLALHEHGLPNAVATLGTSVGREHVDLLFRRTTTAVFCFDGDRAGRDAAWRAVENTLPVIRDGCEARFLFLPEGEDPDSLIRKEGQARFEERLQSAAPLSEYFFGHIAEGLDLETLEGRARLVEKARPWLARLQGGVMKTLMRDRLAELAGMSPESLSIMPTKTEPPDRQQKASLRHGRRQSREDWSLAHRAAQLLLNNPTLAEATPDAETWLAGTNTPGADLLARLVAIFRRHPYLNIGALLERWPDRSESAELAELAARAPDIALEDIAAEWEGAMHHLRARRDEQRLDALITKSRNSQLSAKEKDELRRLISERSTQNAE